MGSNSIYTLAFSLKYRRPKLLNEVENSPIPLYNISTTVFHISIYMHQGFIQDFLPGREIRFYVFLNMYSVLCFPFVLLLGSGLVVVL